MLPYPHSPTPSLCITISTIRDSRIIIALISILRPYISLSALMKCVNAPLIQLADIELFLTLQKNRSFLQRVLNLIALCLLLLTFSAKTLKRNSEWQNTESIAQSSLKVNPGNAKLHMSMGNVLAQQVCVCLQPRMHDMCYDNNNSNYPHSFSEQHA